MRRKRDKREINPAKGTYFFRFFSTNVHVEPPTGRPTHERFLYPKGGRGPKHKSTLGPNPEAIALAFYVYVVGSKFFIYLRTFFPRPWYKMQSDDKKNPGPLFMSRS